MKAEEVQTFEHQIGGWHEGDESKGLLVSGGTVLKPLQSGSRGDREVEFYQSIFPCLQQQDHHQQQKHKQPHALSRFVPRFYGCEEITFQSQPRQFMKLENILSGLADPSVMDLKMGTQSFEPGAPPDKVARELSKCPSQLQLGFRLTGAQCYQPTTQPPTDTHPTPHTPATTHKYFDKHYGRALDKHSFTHMLRKEFFCAEDGQIATKAVELVLTQVREITQWFETQTEFHFFASSLLVCFDGKYKKNEGMTSACLGNGMGSDDGVRVKMIDFAHVRRDQEGVDVGYLLGLRVFGKILEELLERI